MATPAAFFNRAARRILFSALTRFQAARKAASAANGSSLGNSSSARKIHLSPMASVIAFVNPGLLDTTHRRGVTPLVTPSEFFPERGRQSPARSSRKSRVCRAATPFTACPPTTTEMGHAHVMFARFVDQRHPAQEVLVARSGQPHFRQEPAVDLVNDFQVPGRGEAKRAAASAPTPRAGACGWCRRRFGGSFPRRRPSRSRGRPSGGA